MTNEILYKFRSLDNWKFVLDIIVNKRLYAAPFHALNDPMEGRYFYFDKNVSSAFFKAIRRSKMRRNICSLSRARDNTLLWSYYAGGHTGIAVGVRIPRPSRSRGAVRPVHYDNGIYIDRKAASGNPDTVALDILCQKQLPWEHEEEVRVFVPENYVSVTIAEIVLGCNIAPADEELITSIARRWHPRIKIIRIERSALDKPEAVTRRSR